MARFFIERPVFAWVIAIIIMLAGVLAIRGLPVEQYPSVAPPTVAVNATYPGASAKTVENAVTQVIEQRLTGIDYLRYFTASSSDGSATITLTFEPEADPDIAQVQTQNKVQGALSQLPQAVQQQGVTVTKSNDTFLLVVGVYSPDSSVPQGEISDMLVSRFREPLSRINGVGSVTVFGAQHAMRIWLNPDRMNTYRFTPIDVVEAIEAQNTDVTAGELGARPAVEGQALNATVTARSLLQTEQDFRDLVLRVNPDGSRLRLSDVARVELGQESYNRIVRYRRQPAAGMAVSLSTGANALQTAEEVKARVAELAEFMPAGLEYTFPFDTTPFIELSIEAVVQTLIEAVGLVFLVMLLFLQNLRATLIPTIAVPVVLLGTFAVLYAFGFTINMLTMFAMVLAIGLLVDDAIVVVENVERVMSEEGLSPREATRKSMKQITGALVGIAVVLSTVFIPMAFFSGSAGAIYRQFSITIVSAMTLSVLVALILSPTLCATLLKEAKDGGRRKETGFFGWFNRHFNRARDGYQKSAGHIAGRFGRYFGIYLLLVAGMAVIFLRLPTAFLPDEDQGSMFLTIKTPPGATAQRTLESVKKVEDFLLDERADVVQHLFTVVGFSFAGSAQNAAIGFTSLKDWSERQGEGQSIFALQQDAFRSLSGIQDADVFAFVPPPIRALGNATGFDMQLVDRAGLGHEALMAARDDLLRRARQNPLLSGVRPNGLDDVPRYDIHIDSTKAAAHGVSLQAINRTLQIAWGSSYVNDFLDDGRIKRVYVQADAPFRMMPDDLSVWHVRNEAGEMVSFDSFATGQWGFGSPKLERFNGVSSLNIQGGPAPGVSSGVAMDEMADIVREHLPDGLDVAWSGISYEERASGAQAPLLYALSVLVVFLFLAALYESWAVPLAVLLVAPIGVLGAVVAAYLFGLSNDVYFQVALLTTVGLASKNAILIVEFAKEMVDDGTPLLKATAIAARQRFRPILMTSLAFVLGVTPLALADSAGAASQNAIGIAVMGGMLAATFLAIFFVPMFYVAVEKLFRGRRTVSRSG
ncbi:efflux RND transporter permease subunit [Yunchengibacter salinarum]|uniref:efflux RND transporter permease subunit n=1 Tax=Yunchengibacter salinarum TaxID=3133399 RepID=UPI0035B674D4